MKENVIWLAAMVALAWHAPAQAQHPARFSPADSVKTQKSCWRPAAEIVGVNAGVWAFSRYAIADDKVYNISLSSMRRNLQRGFVWDNDQLATNLLGHPYHGGLYFNAARANGMNFWQAAPYAVAGSLMWEYLMETEAPSMNDFIATPVGGMALGEVAFRLSVLLIDNRATGWERFGRELLSMLISPMSGLHRICSGEAWKTGSYRGDAAVAGNTPVHFYVGAGRRAPAEDSEIKSSIGNAVSLDLKLRYGNLFSEENEKPYDAFRMGASLSFLSQQPLIGNISVVGQLWGKNIPLKSEKSALHWGVFQHFDYYDSNTVAERQQVSSYRIAEAAALGVGGQYRRMSKRNAQLFLSAHLNGILLGGSATDYYRAVNRDYNLGSGFSAKLSAGLLGRKVGLYTKVESYRLFTWKGYDPATDLTQLSVNEQQALNAQGDKGSARFAIRNVDFYWRFAKHYTLSLEASYYLRSSYYKYFQDVRHQIMESKIGVGYLF